MEDQELGESLSTLVSKSTAREVRMACVELLVKRFDTIPAGLGATAIVETADTLASYVLNGCAAPSTGGGTGAKWPEFKGRGVA